MHRMIGIPCGNFGIPATFSMVFCQDQSTEVTYSPDVLPQLEHGDSLQTQT